MKCQSIFIFLIILLATNPSFLIAQNVGIGTINPKDKLSVDGTIRSERNSTTTIPHLQLWENAFDFSRIMFRNDSTATNFTLAGRPADDPLNARFHIYNSAFGNVFSVTGDGKSGFNISNPLAMVHANSTTGVDPIRIQNVGSTRFRIFSNNAITFGANWASPIPNVIRFVTPNMFIGFSASHVPVDKLEVDGTVRMSGFNMPVGFQKNFVLTSDATGEGSWASLPPDQVDDADADPQNEIQVLSKTGNTISLSNGGGSIIDDDQDADFSLTNELQNLSIIGSTLSISNGNSVTLPGGGGGGTFISDPSGNEIVETDRSSTYPQVVMDVDGTESFIFNRSSGVSTLTFNNSGGNVAITGFVAPTITGGLDNVSIGKAVQASSLTGDRNVILGVHSSGNWSGNDNIVLGNEAGSVSESRSRNVVIGANSGQSLAGNENVCIGYLTGNGAGQESVYIGNNAKPNGQGNWNRGGAIGYLATTTASNQYVIGNSVTSEIGGYEPWSNLSDGRFKRNVKEDVPGLEFINVLRPVTYNVDNFSVELFLRGKDEYDRLDKIYKRDIASSSQKIETGFIAQEVEAAAQLLGYDFDAVKKPQNEGDPYALAYSQFVVPLVKAVQQLDEKNEKLARENEALKLKLVLIAEEVKLIKSKIRIHE